METKVRVELTKKEALELAEYIKRYFKILKEANSIELHYDEH